MDIHMGFDGNTGCRHQHGPWLTHSGPAAATGTMGLKQPQVTIHAAHIIMAS